MLRVHYVNAMRILEIYLCEVPLGTSALHYLADCVAPAGRQTAAPRGGRTGGWTSRGCGRTREPTSRVGGRTGDQDGQGGDRGNHASNIQGNVRGVNAGNGQNGCSYKEFMACNPKDYDGKGGAIVYNR
ncbi:hypothetical protein Tco_1510028 [Tanacetum coccineum]